MEGEVKNFMMVWSIAIATMCYCHTIGKLIPQGGASRLTALSPAILILLLLPLRLISVHLGGPTCFFLAWLATFKLLLFALARGPLSDHPPLSLPHFILIACLPIKPNNTNQNQNQNQPNSFAFISMAFILLATFIPLYGKKEELHPKFLLMMYGIHVYIALEFIFGFIAASARKLLGVQLEAQFKEPYLSTSLQDFWGKRWNMTVSQILHPTVYVPVVTLTSPVIGRKWAPLPAIVASFAVSGIMHEVIFYYIKRENRTWESWDPSWGSMCFFLVHGVGVAAEVGLKKALQGKNFHLPTGLSWLLSLAFLGYTAVNLFLPALVRSRTIHKASTEFNDVLYAVSGLARFANVTSTSTSTSLSYS